MVAESKGSNIKALMQMHDLTIESLAQELNLSISTINRLLVSSKVDPKLSTLKPIAKFFGVSIEELIGERPLNIKAGDSQDTLPNNQIIMQVPIIHWEQVKDVKTFIPTLNFQLWENWTPVSDDVGENAYALIIRQSSLPAPFYYRSIIVISPSKKPIDNDFVLVLHENNPILCKYILNGIEKTYKSLHLDEFIKGTDIKICGTVVQWTVRYHEKIFV